MSIKRRASQRRRIVSHFDPALALLSVDSVRAYVETLDIDKLGPLDSMKERPSVFTIEPLSVKYEHLAYDTSGTDWWAIFAAHVKDVTEIDFELTYSDGVINHKHREDFPPEIVQNIASIIVTLANRSSDAVFFSPPAGFLGFQASARSRAASMAVASASMAAAKIKKQK